MKVPGNMMTPKLKLDDGEQVVQSAEGLRKKGIFGNRFGVLNVTDKRVAFVKSTMRAGLVGVALAARGAKPMLAFDRKSITATKVQLKKQMALQLSDGTKTENFVIDEAEIDAVLNALK